MDEQFWQNERDLLYAILFAYIVDAAIKAASNAVEEMVTTLGIGVDWALVNVAVRDWAGRYTFELVQGITNTSETFLQTSLANWIDSGQPLSALITEIEPMFGRMRAEMIASTEVTRAFAEGNLATWRASGVVEGKRWQVAGDERVCPICQPLQGITVTLGELFDGRFNGPPAHVRCRCWLQPVVINGR